MLLYVTLHLHFKYMLYWTYRGSVTPLIKSLYLRRVCAHVSVVFGLQESGAQNPDSCKISVIDIQALVNDDPPARQAS